MIDVSRFVSTEVYSGEGSLDLSVLGDIKDNERVTGEGSLKLWGPCPACRENGRDSRGEHLVIFPSGAYGCCLYPAEAADLGERDDHLRRIWELAGGKGKLKKPVEVSDSIKAKRQAIKAKGQAIWESIKATPKTLQDLGESLEIPEDPKDHFRQWVRLFDPADLLWVGVKYETREAFARHCFKPADLEKAWGWVQSEGLDLCFRHSWQSTDGGRQKTNYGAKRFFVLEHDKASREEQIALFAYAISEWKWKLLAVLDTGGKGYHAYFDPCGIITMQDQYSAILSSFSADTGVFNLGHTRIPGAVRQKTETNDGGKVQKFVWLSTSLVKEVA
jgi:hypothetical protein